MIIASWQILPFQEKDEITCDFNKSWIYFVYI